jgi:hypothetical protein
MSMLPFSLLEVDNSFSITHPFSGLEVLCNEPFNAGIKEPPRNAARDFLTGDFSY